MQIVKHTDADADGKSQTDADSKAVTILLDGRTTRLYNSDASKHIFDNR